MITFRQLDPASADDIARIVEAVTHPSIWKHVADDGTPPREQWQPIHGAGALYAGVFADDIFLGVFAFYAANSICSEVHTCLLPVAWGQSIPIAAACLEWVWTTTAMCHIITSVPQTNRLALRLAEGVGFKRYGVNERAWLKDGKLQDIILLGISKPEETESCP